MRWTPRPSITRQTTHHHPLPEQVTVLRACHALEGKSVTVLRQRLKNGRLHLLLAPPGADPVLISADWTDFSIRKQSVGPTNTVVAPSNPSCTLGSIANLMQVRTVVDGLLRSLSATGSDTQQPRDMEGTGATVPNFLIQPQSATPLDQLEPAQRAEVVQALAGIITKAASRAA